MKKIILIRLKLVLVFLNFIFISNVYAENHTLNLVVNYKWVNFTGKRVRAIAVNDQIPAPTLHFEEGDTVSINVINHLDKNTSIHWHGLIVPWQMDGVEGVSQKGIPPGGVFHYRFKLNQSGTYWYHAHAGLQEQQGLYGALIIDLVKHPAYAYNKDYVVVLSDWSNINPEKIIANLKKEGDYYSPNFPLQPSLMHFIDDYRHAKTSNEREQILNDYKMMQQMRMSIYDIGDVAYDAFLLNGHSNVQPWTALVKKGDIVRLRFIGAMSSTNFHVKIPGSIMKIVHIEGNDIKPYNVNDFFITPGETYDVLIKIQQNRPYVIYAESADTSGAAIGALKLNQNQTVDYKHITPFPKPIPVTREMMLNMGMNNAQMHQQGMKKGMGMAMNMNSSEMMNFASGASDSMNMNMPTESSNKEDKISNIDVSNLKTAGTKYQRLRAAVHTNNPDKPINGVIKMELFGYMDHFIWMINGLPEYKTHPIIIESNKRYRFIFTNNSMMHHPMHIHGHWFILRNGHGVYDPLLHTIDVPPGATVVADLDADASGQWFFHCHHLYHMMAGMSRVFQYESIIDISKGKEQPQNTITKASYINRPVLREDAVIPIDNSLIDHVMGHSKEIYFSTILDVGADLFNNTQKFTFKGLYGSDDNKLELFSNDAEIKKGTVDTADVDIFYWHLVSQFWAIKGGANYHYRPANAYWQPGIGIEGLMPYFIDTDLRSYYHNGSTKLDLDLSRDTQITNNFFLRIGIRGIFATKTVSQDEVGSGLNQLRFIVRPYYRLMPGLSLFTEYEHESDYGALSNILQKNAEDSSENSVTVGLSFLF